jgi:hypothetical protein
MARPFLAINPKLSDNKNALHLVGDSGALKPN